jgi:hypothetical protein
MTYRKKPYAGMSSSDYLVVETRNKIFDIRDAGCYVDGVHDDTENVQATINEAAIDGGTVLIPDTGHDCLIAGELKNDIDGIDYNSQLYIPPPATINEAKYIKITGEGHKGYVIGGGGSRLRSTIAGSGVFPSIICAKGYGISFGNINYNPVAIENLTFHVEPFVATKGVSMCGINLLEASTVYLDKIFITPYFADGYSTVNIGTLIMPENHVFGIGLPRQATDFPIIGSISVFGGFYYGVLVGEGCKISSLFSAKNYIGVSMLKNLYGSIIKGLDTHWNTYALSSQQETIADLAPSYSTLKVEFWNIEKCLEGYYFDTPVWTQFEDYILDTNNHLLGEVSYSIDKNSGGDQGAYMTKSHGGYNLLTKNIVKTGTFHWTTTARPSVPQKGMVGYNTTTDKLECYNGSTWNDLF